jgi:hypothetical protein
VATADNSNNSYEDTFFPYFFTHVSSFISAGFIGFLVGKGLADDTDYSNETEGAVADRGWFFSNLKAFDKNRPYLPLAQTKPGRQNGAKTGHGTIRFSNNTLTIAAGAASGNIIVDMYTPQGAFVKRVSAGAANGAPVSISLHDSRIACGTYLLLVSQGRSKQAMKILVSK